MSRPAINLHRINNYLLRLRSITDLIVENGEGFIDEEVFKDINEALDVLKEEFNKGGGDHDHSKPQ
jgi:hypothetical protein